MPLPPATILVKRKATDEPVDFLRVHEANGKRQRRATDFVFSRQQPPDAPDTLNPLAPAPEPVRKIKAHRSVSSYKTNENSNSLGATPKGKAEPFASSNTNTNDTAASNTETKTVKRNGNTRTVQHDQEPRRFHMSRAATSQTPDQGGSLVPGQKRGSKPETVFVERRVKPKLLGNVGAGNGAIAKDVLPEPFLPPGETRVQPQKKPGLASRRPIPHDTGPAQETIKTAPAIVPTKARLPMPQVYSDDFVAQMQAYTLQEIGHSIAESETFNSKPSTPSTTPRKPQKPKFTPKRPALRYHERHPEEFATPTTTMQINDHISDQEDADDDSEYIIDTYIRIPADSMDIEDDEQPKDFGLLILDSQPDIDDFYREEADSDEEEEDEEEDENAENHYSADYPDEEVDTDDEYGRNAYNYRNHNASDLEEFDEDDATFSDEDNDATKYPWMKKPTWTAKDSIDDEMMDES
ncbi:hypothetical protein PVAG01_09379 [Phlyctema vagabunda]|uniref:Transcription factor Iwr1 domain-containing protein n=1 Tax=Phlyctema vagabunda TaxID=108571 RepID=A0ABR4P774_9HELO